MRGYVLRRSLVSLSFLGGLLVLGGGLLVAVGGVPFQVPLIVGVLVVLLQYAIGPALVERLVPARELERSADGYEVRFDSDRLLAEIVTRQCRAAGVPLVRLGIIDDGTPNAFTFGHTRRDARVRVSRGLLDRLDERELDAVVAHEIGHVAHGDFIVMTFASVVPMILYYLYIGARTGNRPEGTVVAAGAFVGYLIAQLAVLALARTRELGADHASCLRTGDGDALCSALVKVAYGIGRSERDRAVRYRELVKDKERKEARKLQRRATGFRTAGVLGIADASGAAAVTDAIDAGLPPERVLAALRWDACNPWAVFSEKLAGHPLVLHRIAALETSGLPGAPTRWHASEVAATCSGPEVDRARRRFALELPVRYLGWVALIAAVAVGRIGGIHATALPVLVLVAGALLTVRALLRVPLGRSEDVEEIASLIERLDASPVTGIPVTLRGHVTGRGVPGYVLSPDLVVADASGFVAVQVKYPLPFAREIFALAKAGRYAEQEVLVEGWYRREAGPSVELRSIIAADGTRTRGWQYVGTYVTSVLILVAGALMVAAG